MDRGSRRCVILSASVRFEPTVREGADPLAVIATIPLGAYAFWAVFWGILGLAKYWKQYVWKVGRIAFRLERLRQRIHKGLTVWRGLFGALIVLPVFLFEWAVYFTAMLTASYVYGLFGGGIYQFVRHRRAARTAAAAA